MELQNVLDVHLLKWSLAILIFLQKLIARGLFELWLICKTIKYFNGSNYKLLLYLINISEKQLHTHTLMLTHSDTSGCVSVSSV